MIFCLVRGGLTLREGMDLLRSLSRTGRLSAVDLVEVNPLIGSDSDKLLTLDAARHLAAAAAGYYAGGWSPKGVSEIPRLRWFSFPILLFLLSTKSCGAILNFILLGFFF